MALEETLLNIITKLADGQRPAANELDDLRNAVRAVEEVKNAVKSWLQPGSTDPHFNHIRSETGYFFDVPLNTLIAKRVSTQVIEDDTETEVELDNSTKSTASIKVDETVADSKIYILPGKAYGFMGTVQWETNATGRRGVHVKVYNDSDVLLFGQTLHSLKPEGTEPDTMPFADAIPATPTAAYMVFTVYQNSGGQLDLDNFQVTIFEVAGAR